MTTVNAIRDVGLDVTGATWEWAVTELAIHERLNAPFLINIECSGRVDGISASSAKLRALIGARATLTLPGDASGTRRILVALVDSIERTWGSVFLALVPIGTPVLASCDYHVDLAKDPVTIVTAFLTAAGYGVALHVGRSVPPRPQCVQAFETGQGYVDRLLAEEGIAWFADPDDSTKIVLCDEATLFPKHPGKFDATESRGLLTRSTGSEVVRDARVFRRVRTSKVTLRDWNFENPALDLTTAKDAGGKLTLERYEYPGGYDNSAVGKQLAALRLDAHRGDIWTLQAETPCTTIAPGQVLTIDSPRATVQGDWLVTGVALRTEPADADEAPGAYRDQVVARFEAVRASLGARPPVPATHRMPGIQTMTVTGAPGEEIHPDEHCRIKTLHRWDREHGLDDKASAWQRVMQPAMPGAMLVPRVGWEAIAGYYGRSAEDPVILGRLDTGRAPPPASLPAQKVVSSFGSCTTPGGGSFNGVSFSDTAGGEGMHVTASAAYNERTANDKAADVVGSCGSSIGGNHNITVGTGHELVVGGAHNQTISGSRTENVTSDIAIKAGSEKVGIGGARMFNIAGNQDITCAVLGRLVGAGKMVTAIESVSTKVTGAMAVNVGAATDQTSGASWDVTVAGLCEEIVTGVKSITCAGAYEMQVRATVTETYASRTVTGGGHVSEHANGALTVSSKGAANMKGANVYFKGANITLKAGGITITIKPGKVVVDGDYKSSQSAVNDSGEAYG
jgi:type VI secretion system secreted protein VgrG